MTSTELDHLESLKTQVQTHLSTISIQGETIQRLQRQVAAREQTISDREAEIRILLSPATEGTMGKLIAAYAPLSP